MGVNKCRGHKLIQPYELQSRRGNKSFWRNSKSEFPEYVRSEYGHDVQPEEYPLDNVSSFLAKKWLGRNDQLNRELADHRNVFKEVGHPDLEVARSHAEKTCAKLTEILEAAFSSYIEQNAFRNIEETAHKLEFDVNQFSPLNESSGKEFSLRREALNKELAFHLQHYHAKTSGFREE